MNMDRSHTEELYRAVALNNDEHARLRPILASIESAQGLEALVPLLKELHQALMRHFAGEQFPDGLFDVIEQVNPEHANSLRELEGEHSFFMHKVRDLIFHARTPGENNPEELLNGAQELVRKFRVHEERENTVVAQILETD